MARIKPYDLRDDPRAGLRGAESESEVENCQVSGPEAKKRKKQTPKNPKSVLGKKFCVESEFEVKISGFRRPGAKIHEQLPRICYVLTRFVLVLCFWS